MDKEATSKRKLKVVDKAQRKVIDGGLPKVRSSKELLRRIQIKLEKITSIELPTKASMVFAKGQFSLSNFEVGAENKKNTLTIDVEELQYIQPRQPQKEKIFDQLIHDSRTRVKAIERSLFKFHSDKRSNKRKLVEEYKSNSKLETIERDLIEVECTESRESEKKTRG